MRRPFKGRTTILQEAFGSLSRGAGADKGISEEKPSYMSLPKRPAAALLLFAVFFVVLVCQKVDVLVSEDMTEETREEPEQSLAQRPLLLRPHPDLCKGRHFIVGVHVRVDAFEGRTEWRHTLGQLQQKHNFSLIFALGKPKEKSIYRRIEEEHLEHGDLLLGDFDDSYRNMTHKHLMLLRFVHQQCENVPFLVKLDDDVAVNIAKLHDFVSRIYEGPPPWFGIDRSNGPKIWCNVWSDTVVRRAAGGKWSVPRSRWEPQMWPQYCAGMSYIASQEAIGRLLDATEEERWLWVDDIFVTGLLAQRGGVQLVSLNWYYGLNDANIGPLERGWAIFQLTRRRDTRSAFEAANY